MQIYSILICFILHVGRNLVHKKTHKKNCWEYDRKKIEIKAFTDFYHAPVLTV